MRRTASVIDDSAVAAAVAFTAAAAAVLGGMKYLITRSKQFGVKNKLHMDSSARLHSATLCSARQDMHLTVPDCGVRTRESGMCVL